MEIKKEVLDFISKDYEKQGKCLDDFDVLTNSECINYIIYFYNYKLKDNVIISKNDYELLLKDSFILHNHVDQ